MTLAMYKGVEGELPFPFYGKSDMLFADLRTSGRRFRHARLQRRRRRCLFLGEWVEFEELQAEEPAAVRGVGMRATARAGERVSTRTKGVS